jgi:hypothetical protein
LSALLPLAGEESFSKRSTQPWPAPSPLLEGNTADPTTVASQLTILKEQLGIAEVVLKEDPSGRWVTQSIASGCNP